MTTDSLNRVSPAGIEAVYKKYGNSMAKLPLGGIIETYLDGIGGERIAQYNATGEMPGRSEAMLDGNETLNEITLYQCTRCNGIFQDLITECDCTVNADFAYRILYAYPEQQREIPVVNERELRKSIASELTRCAESAESHDWNNQTHRQRMVNAVILALRPHLREPKRELVARPASEWHEDIGPVLWWTSPVTEPAYCGTPLDDDFPPYMKHWTPLQVPTTCIEDGQS